MNGPNRPDVPDHRAQFEGRASVSERVIVIDRGAKIAEGDAEQILNTPEVVTAYLGKRRG